MGYYTRFELTWETDPSRKGKPACEHDPITPFCSICGKARGVLNRTDEIQSYLKANEKVFYGVNPDGTGKDECKWYDWKENMQAMSKVFPDVLFKLHGEGEETGDIWDAYFLAGKVQVHKAEIKIAPYNPNVWDK